AISVASIDRVVFRIECEQQHKEYTRGQLLADKLARDPTARMQRADAMALVTRGLNRDERLIVILYYYEELTMKEIGATLNLSESRVSQLHSRILERLRQTISGRRGEIAA